MRHNNCVTKNMHLFLHKHINYGHVTQYAYVYPYLSWNSSESCLSCS